MRPHLMLTVALVIFASVVVVLNAAAQDDRGGPPPQDRGGPDGRGGGPRGGGPDGPGGRSGFHLLPPFVQDKLNLSDDQLEQVAALEKETKAKLYKILTAKQQKILETTRPPRPGEGNPGGQGRGRRRSDRGPGNNGRDDEGPGRGPGGE
jgi:hypothetical protein